jgi:hypothetical protein
METYRAETLISKDGTLTVEGLPFRKGDKVEVVVRSSERKGNGAERYPLRGKMIRYVDPFKSVAEDDWEVLA